MLKKTVTYRVVTHKMGLFKYVNTLLFILCWKLNLNMCCNEKEATLESFAAYNYMESSF